MFGFSKLTIRFLLVWVIMGCAAQSHAKNTLHFLADKEMMDLLQKQNCLNCHAVEQKKLGPSFMQIAQKYAENQPKNQAHIVRVIQYGSRGQWGVVPMLGNAKISEAQSQQIAQWILNLPVQKIPKNNIID